MAVFNAIHTSEESHPAKINIDNKNRIKLVTMIIVDLQLSDIILKEAMDTYSLGPLCDENSQ